MAITKHLPALVEHLRSASEHAVVAYYRRYDEFNQNAWHERRVVEELMISASLLGFDLVERRDAADKLFAAVERADAAMDADT